MSRYPGWTDEEIAELKGYLNDGASYKEIAELMGKSHRSIQCFVSRHKWGVRQNKQVFLKDVQKKIDTMIQKQNIKAKTSILALKPVEENEMPKTMIEKHTPVMEKTLKDFTPREIIRYLYNLGYRIENNSLVCYVKQTVNVKDIING